MKTSECSRHQCNCKEVLVSAVGIMFDEHMITITDKCTMRYYSRGTGRELGSRKDQYKDGNLIPWTVEDQADWEIAQEEKRHKEEKLAMAKQLSSLLFSNTNYDATLNNNMTAEKIAWAIGRLQDQ